MSLNQFGLVLLSAFLIFISKFSSAQSAPPESFEIVFLTDVHLPNKSHALEGYAQAVKEINALEPAFVINGGDMIMDALKALLDSALLLTRLYDSISASIAKPVCKTIGNHDIFGVYFGDSLLQHPAYGKHFYEQNFGAKYYIHDHENWRFFFLDGIKITDNHKYIGEIDSLQMNWIKSVLDTTSLEKQLAIITHIPFYTAGYQIWIGSQEAAPPHGVVHNSNDVIALFSNHRLKLILQGHLHIFEKIFMKDMWVITGGAVSSRWWQGKNNGMEEGFTKLKLFHNGEVEAIYHAIDWEVPEKNR